MSADRIEIAKQCDLPSVVRLVDVGQDPLLHCLGFAVRVGSFAQRAFFRDRHECRIAVYSGGRREDDLEAVVIAHDVAQHQGGHQVVGVVFDRFAGRLADSLVAGKVNDGVNAFPIEQIVQGILVQDVDFIKSRAFAGDGLDAVDDHGFGIIKIICNHDFIAAVEKFHDGMRADKTGTASYQNFHDDMLFSLLFHCNTSIPLIITVSSKPRKFS